MRNLIVDAVNKTVREFIELAYSPMILPLKINCEFPSATPGGAAIVRQDLDLAEFLEQWIYGENGNRLPHGAILTGHLGSGKTMATCRVTEILNGRSDDPHTPSLILWIPCRRTVFYDQHVDIAIPQQLGLPDASSLWGEEANLRCIILDGIDEAMSYYNNPRLIPWLTSLLFDRCVKAPSQPRVMLVGRDTMLERPVVNRELYSLLQEFCQQRARGRPAVPMYARMKSWQDPEIRKILVENLTREHNDEEKAQNLVDRVRGEFLTSPLLFGLAFKLLADKDEAENAFDEIPHEWELTKRWINVIVGRDREGFYLPLDWESRRHAAEEIALYLAVSGRGLAGASQAEISELRANYQLNAVVPELFDADATPLKTGTLLSENRGNFAPFHEGILIHLAAEALERWREEAVETPRFATHTALGQLFEMWWSDLSGTADFGLPPVMERIGRMLSHLPARSESSLADVLDRWIRYCWPLDKLRASRVPDLPPLEPDAQGELEGPRIRAYEMLVLLRNVIRNRTGSHLHQSAHRTVATLIPRPDRTKRQPHDLGERWRARTLALEYSFNSPVEFSNTGMIFVPGMSLFDARRFRDLLLQHDLLDAGWSCEFRPFRDYLIDRLIIERRDNIVVENLDSRVSVEAIVGQAIEYSDPVTRPDERSDRPLNADVFHVRADGSLQKLSPSAFLHDYALVTGDRLMIIADDREGLRDASTEHPPPPSNLLDTVLSGDPGTLEISTPVLRSPSQSSSSGVALLESIETKLFRAVPAGRMPVWLSAPRSEDQRGFRTIHPQLFERNVYISTELVTVSEYAAFLLHNPLVELPRVPDVGWRRDGIHVHYRLELGNQPVTGVSLDEAQLYVEWFGSLGRALPDGAFLKFRLPEPQSLQIAALGDQLADPATDGVGPYGHRDLTGRCWQWTTALRGNLTLAFGGGASPSATSLPGSAQKELMRGHPDLCRELSPRSHDSHVGFRLSIVDLKE